jgi:Ran GTPase-activating protein (RanGAP) involved in mRNA processing and transport
MTILVRGLGKMNSLQDLDLSANGIEDEAGEILISVIKL